MSVSDPSATLRLAARPGHGSHPRPPIVTKSPRRDEPPASKGKPAPITVRHPVMEDGI